MRTFNFKYPGFGLRQVKSIWASRPGEITNIHLYTKRETVLNVYGYDEIYDFYLYSDPIYSIGRSNNFNLSMRYSCLQITGWAGECRDNFNLNGDNNKITLNNSLLYVFNITGQNNLIWQKSRKANYRIGERSGAFGGKISSGTEITLTSEADRYPVLPFENSGAVISLICVGSHVTVKRAIALDGTSASMGSVWLGTNQHPDSLDNTDPEGNWQQATWTATERDSYNVQAENFVSQFGSDTRGIFNINGNGYRVSFDITPGAAWGTTHAVCNVFANYLVLKDTYGLMNFIFRDRNVDGRIYIQGPYAETTKTKIQWFGSRQARFSSLFLKGNVEIDMNSRDQDSNDGSATISLNFGLPAAVQGDQHDTFVLIRNNRKRSAIFNGGVPFDQQNPAAGAIQNLTIDVGGINQNLYGSLVDPVYLEVYTTGNIHDHRTIVNDDSYNLHLDTSYGTLLNIYGLPDQLNIPDLLEPNTSVVVNHAVDHFDQGVARDQINVDCFGFLDLTCSHRSDIYEAFTKSKTIKVASSDSFAASQMTLNIDQHALAFRSAWTIDDYVDGLLVNLGAYSSVSQDAGWDCGFIDLHPADSFFSPPKRVSIRNAAGETRNYVNNTSETQRIVFNSTGTINSAGLTSIP